MDGLTLGWEKLWLDEVVVRLAAEVAARLAVEVAARLAVEVAARLAVEVTARLAVDAAVVFTPVAGWLALARPTLAPKASAEPSRSPRRASSARRRAILIGVFGIDRYGTSSP